VPVLGEAREGTSLLTRGVGVNIVANVHRVHYTGGVELSVLHATRELVRRGHEVHLIYGQGGDLIAEYERLCASVRRVRFWDFTFPQDRVRAAVERVRLVPAVIEAARCRPDVYYMSRTFAAYWALDAAKISPAPVVCHWRGTATPPRRYVQPLSEKVSRFISNSQFTRQAWLEAGFDAGKIDVVYAGIDPSEYPVGGSAEREVARASLGISQDAFVALFIGRLDPEKGVEVLLDAWHRLGATQDEAVLLLLGAPVTHGDPVAYLAQLKALAQGSSVRFLGAGRDVVTPLFAADVSVVPSTWAEPFGRVVVEALATGRPVIASRVGGIPEILAVPLQRFLFDRGDAAGLATLLSGIVGWQEREPQLARICTDRVQECFTLTKMVDGIEASMRLARQGPW